MMVTTASSRSPWRSCPPPCPSSSSWTSGAGSLSWYHHHHPYTSTNLTETHRSLPFSYQELAASLLASLRRFPFTKKSAFSKDIPANYSLSSVRARPSPSWFLSANSAQPEPSPLFTSPLLSCTPLQSGFSSTRSHTAMFQTNICCDCKKNQFCRNSMLGVCSTIARVGGVAAPWIAVYLPTQVAFFNPLCTHRTLLMNDLHRFNQIKKSFLFFCRVP